MVTKYLKKYIFVILAVLIAVGGYLYVLSVGKEYTYVRNDFNESSGITEVFIENDSIGNAEILGWEVTEKNFTVRLRSVSPGRFYVRFETPNSTGIGVLYAHKNGVITSDRFFGDCTGDGGIDGMDITYVVSLMTYDHEMGDVYGYAADVFVEDDDDCNVDGLDLTTVVNVITYDIDLSDVTTDHYLI